VDLPEAKQLGFRRLRTGSTVRSVSAFIHTGVAIHPVTS